MTSRRIVRMLWMFAMTPKPSTFGPLSLLAVLALAGCEPADEGPPPATPQAAPPSPDVAAGADPAAQPPPGGGAPDTAYASQEYTLGEDADSYDDNDPAALSDFKGTLDPYGSWVDDPTYGTVWAPSPTTVGPDFRPYVTSGHWVYDDEWVWVSDYPWGWAPFHYGRWAFVEGRGWVWIPGRVYRGAWVVWSADGDFGYLGWAPAPPLFVWFGGVAVGWRHPWGPHWVYCSRHEVFAPIVATHVVVGPAAVSIAARMRVYTPAAGVRVASGPPPERLGLTTAQVPHATGTASLTIARAQQFGRPSTAQPLGASAASRVQPIATSPALARPTVVQQTGPGAGGRFAPAPHAAPPTVPLQRSAPGVAPRVGGPRPAPSFRSGGHFGGGGGGHHH